MSIRAKFFALAGILLLLFGAVVGMLAVFQRNTAHKLADITEHHQPLRRLLADLDVQTDEYELLLARLYIDPLRDDASDINARLDALSAKMRANFTEVNSILDKAIKHNKDDPLDLQVLSRIDGSLPYIERALEPFLANGAQARNAVLTDHDEARQHMLRFRPFESAFGPDLADIRGRITTLTESTTKGIYAEQQLNMWLTFGLFVVASMVGLGISGVGSGQVVGALRKLLDSTKSLESGQTDIRVPVITKDEVGQLARAFNRMVEEIQERDRIKETFGKFLDPRIVTQLIGSTTDAGQIAQRKPVTIFFSDIRGFSTISEQLTPQAMVNMLNEYFTAVADEIRAHNGIVDKYIGDAVMAFWCEPFSAADQHALDGCLAALAQLRAVERIRQRMSDITGLRRNAPHLVVRMGVASGEAVVGVLGSPNSRSFTVIGDTVNTASRLEGVNKVYGTSIIIAEDTFRLVSHAVEVRELDIITVTGKIEPTRIYELLAETGQLDAAQIELVKTYAKGLACYRERRWEDALTLFEDLHTRFPDDGPTGVLLQRVSEFAVEPPSEDWDGIWHLKSK